MNEFSNDEIIFELLEREDGLDEIANFISKMSNYRFKRFMCDIFDKNYHTDNKILIELLKKKLK